MLAYLSTLEADGVTVSTDPFGVTTFKGPASGQKGDAKPTIPPKFQTGKPLDAPVTKAELAEISRHLGTTTESLEVKCADFAEAEDKEAGDAEEV